MKKELKKIAITAALVLATGGAAQAALLDSTGYLQNFDSMGTGNTLPSDWTVFSYGPSGGDHSTWSATTGILATNIANTATGWSQATTAVVKNDGQLTASDRSGSSFYNIGITNSATTTASTNRALATSPTGNVGSAMQLVLTNNTGTAIDHLFISYDMVKATDGTGQGTKPYTEELPGYQLFYSLNNGSTYTNVAALNPVLSTAANPNNQPVVMDRSNQTSTAFYNLAANGQETVTSVKNYYLTLSSALAVGSNIQFRWVDDNGVTVSPDFVYGLDNVSVSAVPVPGAAWLLGSGLLGLAGIRRRKK